MIFENQRPLNPKTKRAALNQAVQCVLAVERNNERRDNIMKHQNEIENKIQKLQDELNRLKNNIEKLDKDSQSYKLRLSQLRTAFEITELEISEAKLQLLKRNLERQQALLQAGLEPDTPEFTD